MLNQCCWLPQTWVCYKLQQVLPVIIYNMGFKTHVCDWSETQTHVHVYVLCVVKQSCLRL